MSMKPQKFLANIDDKGKLAFEDPSSVSRVLALLAGSRIVVTIGKWYKKRSLDENNYYWAVVVQMIADETGEAPERVHYFLGRKFWPDDDGAITIAGETVDAEPKSTTEMTTVEFEENMSKVRAWASEFLGMVIPEPNEDPNRYLNLGP